MVNWSNSDDASYEENMRELAFERMVERGLEDIRNGRVISEEEMVRRIEAWTEASLNRGLEDHASPGRNA